MSDSQHPTRPARRSSITARIEQLNANRPIAAALSLTAVSAAVFVTGFSLQTR